MIKNKHILTTLIQGFKSRCIDVLIECERQGYIYIPYFGYRSLEDQAKLWRQSRSSQQIKETIGFLIENKAFKIAKILNNVGPQQGKWATNAVPGLSWHNHKLALDCFALVDEKASWEVYDYITLADVAQSYGLSSGYFWKSKDAVHIQVGSDKVLNSYNWEELEVLLCG